jgi:hypothetical protein
MVVFQRNGGKQLVTWVTHYSHVLPPDALVLIDHASTDPWTLSLLHEYAMLGIHVWHCPSGSYEYGREKMWSTIARVYQYDSAFIFPLDVDELVTIHDKADSIALDESKHENTMTSDTKRQRRLVWDTHSFYHALDRLATSGKPFKMEQADVVPGDCHLLPDDTGSPNVDPEKASPSTRKMLFPSLVCPVTDAPMSTQPIPVSCMHKNFCRGPDFVQTDLGNHFLATNWTVSKVPKLKHSGYNIVSRCEKAGVYQWYEPSSLVLLHLQRLEFADWILHYLRGASMHGYTKFNASTPVSACPNVARHYCEQWIEFQRYDLTVTLSKITMTILRWTAPVVRLVCSGGFQSFFVVPHFWVWVLPLPVGILAVLSLRPVERLDRLSGMWRHAATLIILAVSLTAVKVAPAWVPIAVVLTLAPRFVRTGWTWFCWTVHVMWALLLLGLACASIRESGTLDWFTLGFALCGVLATACCGLHFPLCPSPGLIVWYYTTHSPFLCMKTCDWSGGPFATSWPWCVCPSLRFAMQQQLGSLARKRSSGEWCAIRDRWWLRLFR